MQLSEFMAQRDLDDADVAAKVSCSRETISRIRRGISRPSFDLAGRIKDFSGGLVTPNDLLDAWLKGRAEPTASVQMRASPPS